MAAASQRKSVFLAWALNFIPGLGLIYVGKPIWGILFIIVAAGAWLIMLTGIGIIIGLPLYILSVVITCIASAISASNYNKSIQS
jgi:TM2 domain-containing membrane protein YozV